MLMCAHVHGREGADIRMYSSLCAHVLVSTRARLHCARVRICLLRMCTCEGICAHTPVCACAYKRSAGTCAHTLRIQKGARAHVRARASARAQAAMSVRPRLRDRT
eukprot:6193900-Pleurochrysis_carterae.AAC.2